MFCDVIGVTDVIHVVMAGCVGGPIQYYGEDRQPGLTTRYCGVEAYWQSPPGQVRNLVRSVSEQFCADITIDGTLDNSTAIH